MGRRGSFSAALNRYVKEVEKEERARQREIAREQKYEEKIYKQKIKERKEQAKIRGYITSGKEADEKLDDASRANASLRDYIFYQFFALDDELDDLTNEQLDEIIYDKKNIIVEWRTNDIPDMVLRPIEEEPVIKENNSFSEIISWIVCIIIWVLLWNLIPDNTAAQKAYQIKQIEKQTDTTSVPVHPEYIYEENTYYNTSSASQNGYKNVELSEEDLRRFNKANERYERNLEKYNKKMERKAKKQAQKEEKKAEKAKRKALKKLEKEQKRAEKKNKKKKDHVE